MGEEGAKGGRKKKGEREKRTRAGTMLWDEPAKAINAGGGSHSFPSYFMSFGLLSLCFGR